MFTTELQYVVVRYMLNELADEAVNVGIIAVTDDPPRIISRFLEDPTVKSRRDARVKKEAVDRFASFLEMQKHVYEGIPDTRTPLTKTFFEGLREFSGGLIRANLPRAVLTNHVEQECDLLFDQLVSPLKSSAVRRSLAPRDPLRGLRKEAYSALIRAFKEGYGSPLSRKLFFRRYPVKGKKHTNTFDFALVGGKDKKRHERLYQHLLVLPDAEESFTQAAGLCWRWSDIRAANHVDRQLTAVLYHRIDKTRDLSDTTRLLRNEDIAVATIEQLPEMARKLQSQVRLFAPAE